MHGTSKVARGLRVVKDRGYRTIVSLLTSPFYLHDNLNCCFIEQMIGLGKRLKLIFICRVYFIKCVQGDVKSLGQKSYTN